jgi:hypothetical protein
MEIQTISDLRLTLDLFSYRSAISAAGGNQNEPMADKANDGAVRRRAGRDQLSATDGVAEN